MIGAALLGLVGYEAVTTLITVAGVKALSFAHIDQQMLGLKRPKTLPIVDKKLKSMVGEITKREQWMSRKAVATNNKLTQYQAFKYAVILGGRKLREDMAQSRSRNRSTGWIHRIGSV